LGKDEVKKFYEAHQAEMQQPEQVRLSEILITPKAAPAPAPTEGATPAAPSQADSDAALAAAQAKAQDLLEQIRKGANFEELAKKFSDGPSAKDGGEDGLFQRGKLSKELEDRVFALKAGEVTDTIRTKQGFLILKVTE